MARPGSRAGSSGPPAELAAAPPVTVRLGWPVLALGAGAALLVVMTLLMPLAVALYLLLCALAGAGLTYLSRLPLRLEERAAFGMVIGAMAATAAGFVAALVIGLNVWSILAGLAVALAVSAAGWRLALGGGGYDLYSAVPRAWTLVFAEMAGVSLRQELPPAWLDFSRSKGSRRLPAGLIDPPTQAGEKEMAEIERVVAAVRQQIPLLS